MDTMMTAPCGRRGEGGQMTQFVSALPYSSVSLMTTATMTTKNMTRGTGALWSIEEGGY